jgi:hypothetical protein
VANQGECKLHENSIVRSDAEAGVSHTEGSKARTANADAEAMPHAAVVAQMIRDSHKQADHQDDSAHKRERDGGPFVPTAQHPQHPQRKTPSQKISDSYVQSVEAVCCCWALCLRSECMVGWWVVSGWVSVYRCQHIAAGKKNSTATTTVAPMMLMVKPREMSQQITAMLDSKHAMRNTTVIVTCLAVEISPARWRPCAPVSQGGGRCAIDCA